MNRKLTFKLLALSALLIFSVACDKKEKNTPTGEVTPPSQETLVAKEEPSPSTDVQEKMHTTKGTMYFPSKAYISDGKTSPKYIEVVCALDYNPDKDQVVNKIIDLFQKISIKDDEATNLVLEGTILSADLKDKIATIDVSRDALAGGGELDEELFIGQVVKSLTSFPEIDGVRFLVDGQEAETLLGHYDISNGRVFESID